MSLQIHNILFRGFLCCEHLRTNNQCFLHCFFGVLVFFPKSCLKVGGAAYTRVFTVCFNLCRALFQQVLYSLRSNLVSRKLITEQFYFPNIMLRTNLLAFGVGGAGFENFESPATAVTGLSCIPHWISSQCTRARESG